jgi:hypothetical protein
MSANNEKYRYLDVFCINVQIVDSSSGIRYCLITHRRKRELMKYKSYRINKEKMTQHRKIYKIENLVIKSIFSHCSYIELIRNLFYHFAEIALKLSVRNSRIFSYDNNVNSTAGTVIIRISKRAR